MAQNPPELSFVIPVYNGAATIGRVVHRILSEFSETAIEVILVNDGSQDQSESVCRFLVGEYPDQLTMVQLARNFGEHNAVLAGLAQARGTTVAVLDDDGQNPPEEVRSMWNCLRDRRLDVVYGRYRVKQHSLLRNFGSYVNDRLATWLLKKPSHIYLSSFKVMDRFIVREILRYRGPFPYIDGLIFRSTSNIDQIDVDHAPRASGQSNYTVRRLLRLWLNMFLGFSAAPLRLSVVVGLTTSALSVLMMLLVVVDKLWVNPTVPVGTPSILVFITFFSGVQLTVLGAVGEYIGRIFLAQSGTPQFVVREVLRGRPNPALDSGAYPIVDMDKEMLNA